MAIVVADNPEQAAELANTASRARVANHDNVDYDLSYYAGNAVLLPAQGIDSGVVALHEYGMPRLPSKGSGIKVKF